MAFLTFSLSVVHSVTKTIISNKDSNEAHSKLISHAADNIKTLQAAAIVGNLACFTKCGVFISAHVE